MKLKNVVRKVRFGTFVAASALLSAITTTAVLQDGSVAQADTRVVVPLPHLRPTVLPIQDGIGPFLETDYTPIELSYQQVFRQRMLDVLRDTKDDPLAKKK